LIRWWRYGTNNARQVDGLSSFPTATKGLIAVFDNLVTRVESRREGMVVESRTLAALRDTLLPTLISGELRVKAAEWLLEATV
jgi:hypothetical protein